MIPRVNQHGRREYGGACAVWVGEEGELVFERAVGMAFKIDQREGRLGVADFDATEIGSGVECCGVGERDETRGEERFRVYLREVTRVGGPVVVAGEKGIRGDERKKERKQGGKGE